jgi:hypothetical protein
MMFREKRKCVIPTAPPKSFKDEPRNSLGYKSPSFDEDDYNSR